MVEFFKIDKTNFCEDKLISDSGAIGTVKVTLDSDFSSVAFVSSSVYYLSLLYSKRETLP